MAIVLTNMYEKLTYYSTTIKYYLSDHPRIVEFTWSPTQSWGSTWPFLFFAITLYLSTAVLLHLALPRRRRLPLGPIPAVHSLLMCAISAVVFAGTLLSAAAEIRETRWLWRRSRDTPLEWLLCFPLGTRPSGRVFFWSYAFYLSRFPDLLRTLFRVSRARELTPFYLLNQSFLVLMSFLWLEFSQSFQVLAILFAALAHTAAYACRLAAEVGLTTRARERGFVTGCRVSSMCFNVVCHVAVLLMHVCKGGCNGIGAWVCNSVLNAVILLLLLKFYFLDNMHSKKTNGIKKQCCIVHFTH